MDNSFKNAFEYKVVYVFTIEDEAHKGYVKIGDATLHTETPLDRLTPNSRELNQAALTRIKSYTNTAGLTPKLLHSEIAVKTICDDDGSLQLQAFRDHHVHDVLRNSGIDNVQLGNSTGREWYDISVETAKKAIDAVKKNYANLSNTDVVKYVPIVFRPEQADCIEKVVKHFKKADRFLINAKMRYGKTFVSLEIVKRCKFKKTIILTHRPVVDSGWYEDFTKIFHGEDYIYGSKATGYTVEQLIATGKNFIYFASVQDIRGSAQVGGKFEKNDIIFDTVWDCVIVDEAHEGTTTALGEDTVKAVFKEGSGTKFLALSGTPFNILDSYDEEAIYTWDYIMEQESKAQWDLTHFGDHNPYDELPELRIYTYSLGDILKQSNYVTFEDKAFNFHEFFRTFTGDFSVDYVNMPEGASVGDFVHEADVWSFLNLLTKQDETSQYPYSNVEYRSLFKHSLWMVPGVREARALKKLMLKHPVFGNGMFDIVNVAGNGDEEEKAEEALSKVRKAIKAASKDDTYTITLSCGKLTTGVTVKEWTAVFMLAGSYSTSAANYLQTIFRVQSPCNEDGKIKETAYVFDFAPDRTLKMVSSAVAVSSKAGKTKIGDKQVLGKFLNYCPVISVSGSEMQEYSATKLLQQLKKAYADKVVRNGFDDSSLYNDELFKLQAVDIERFDELKGIIGKSKAAVKSNDITVNEQGLTGEEYEEVENLQGKKKKELTEEEKARLEELKKMKKLRNDAISILRGISIRMPLLIYGAKIPYDEEITLERFIDMVDETSWEEFMPTGVTKTKFKEFQKYYDEEVFIAAGRRIRDIAREADTLDPTERVKKIASLFKYFKNPDKETVLTPWRVVNMHMSDCLGGWDFWDEEHKETLDEPRFVDRGQVTADVFGKPDTQILEINSKTGLYPLYVTYSVYRQKLEKMKDEALTIEEKQKLWNETVRDNVFVICKTKMAKTITKRTLVGYQDAKINAHCFDDLINMLQNKPELFVKKVLRASYWGKKGNEMKFDAVVGNPPYQIMDGGNGTSAKPIYQLFVENSLKLRPSYLSMITPARWYAGGKGLDVFRNAMLNDKHIRYLVDYGNSSDAFNGVDIAGGVCYFLWERENEGQCTVINRTSDSEDSSVRYLNEFETFIRENKAVKIVHKVKKWNEDKSYLSDRVSSRKPFGLPTNYSPKEKGVPCWFIQKIGKRFANIDDISDSSDLLDKWKLLAPKAPIAGQTDFTKPVGFYYDGNTKIAAPGECCTESFIVLGAFETENEILSYKSYIFTKTVRFLLLQTVVSQDVTKKNFSFIPDLNSYSGIYTDEQLCKMWNITDEEWCYIDSRISNIRSDK